MVRFISDTRKAEADPKQSLLVIGAGLPRAATSSLQAAFEELDLSPCLHMAQILPHADRERIMISAIREKDTARRHKLVHQLVDGHAAICDMPAVLFTPDLMDMYPYAKVVLNGRPSAEVWAQSAYDSLGFFFTWQFKWTGMLWTVDRLWYRMNMEGMRWSREKFRTDQLFTTQMYDGYYQDVRDEAAKRGREVLEFKAEDGWEPLCRFLDKPVPDKPFPKTNERKVFAIVKAVVVARGLLAWAGLAGSIWMAWRYRYLLPAGLQQLKP